MKMTERYSHLQDEPYVKYLQNQCARYGKALAEKNRIIREMKRDITKRKRQILTNIDELKEEIKDIMYVER